VLAGAPGRTVPPRSRRVRSAGEMGRGRAGVGGEPGGELWGGRGGGGGGLAGAGGVHFGAKILKSTETFFSEI